MADQQEIPMLGPRGLAVGDRVERAPTGLTLSSFTIAPPPETGVVVDVITGEAGRVQQVFIDVEGTPGLVVDLHFAVGMLDLRNRWRKAVD